MNIRRQRLDSPLLPDKSYHALCVIHHQKVDTMRYYLLLAIITFRGLNNISAQQINVPYEVKLETVFTSSDQLFLQARAVVLPSEYNQKAFITMSIYGYGTHAYGDLYFLENEPERFHWSVPQIIGSLVQRKVNDTLVKSIGDVTPDWHRKSKTVLCTGKSFFFYATDADYVKGNESTNKRLDIEELQEVAYAVYDPSKKEWSGLKAVELPHKLNNGDAFYGVNAGCTQRVDLPNGNVLLPIRYLKGKQYVSTVILCAYDGKKLKYIKHGSTFTVPEGRGLYEPSLAYYEGNYFLTMRGDKSAYVAKSANGLDFGPMKEWKFDDGEWLGSYNTQQHWISNPKGVFLVYTRKGANNDHIFRHRAPLFIAQVDPEKLCVLKNTERVLMPIPSDGGDVGNFGVTHINDSETWVTVGIAPKNSNAPDRTTQIQVAKIQWAD